MVHGSVCVSELLWGADWQFLLLLTRKFYIRGKWSSKLSSLQYTKRWLLCVFPWILHVFSYRTVHKQEF